MYKVGIVLLGLCCLSTGGRAGEPSLFAAGVASIFRNAIVKIDVSSATPVFRENEKKEAVNVCKSEGTGFLVSSSHVVTAEHVYQLADECGPANIVVKSKKYNLQKLATVVAAKNDVALLKVDSEFPSDMCALGLMTNDVYGVEAIRFGIPGGWDQPGPPAGVTIDQQNGPFAPLTLLSPVVTEKGESGGPVIYVFNVVGITLARHGQYIGYSFMTVGSVIRDLMAASSVRPSGNICNPVTGQMWTNYSPSAPPTSNRKNGGQISGNIFGSIKLDGQLTGYVASAITPNMLDSFKNFGDQSLTVQPSSRGTDISIMGKFDSAEEAGDVSSKAARATNEISQQLRETLWKQFVAESKKAGMWEDAAPIRKAPVKSDTDWPGVLPSPPRK